MLQHEVLASNLKHSKIGHIFKTDLQGIDPLVLEGFAFCRGLSLLTEVGEVLALEKVKAISVANHGQFQT